MNHRQYIANDYNNERPPEICVTNSSASLTHVSENKMLSRNAHQLVSISDTCFRKQMMQSLDAYKCHQPLQDFTCSMMTRALMPSDVSQVAEVLEAVAQNKNQ